MKINKWIKHNTCDLKGKTIAITGSTGDLCKEICFVFASLNANLILINRNLDKSEKQKKDILDKYPNIKIEILICDLNNFENIKNTIQVLKKRQINILYLASGVYNIKRFKTSLGYNNIFQTNFVSHYYIAKELLPQLKTNKGKIIAVSSIAHNYSRLNESDIDFSLIKTDSKVYGNSKRFLTFALHELCNNENVDLSIVHPGVTLTNMTNHYPKIINWLAKIAVKLLFTNKKNAVLPLIKGVYDITEKPNWIGPKIFNIWGKPKKQKLKKYNINESKKIFEISENIYNKIKKEN